MNRIQFQNRPLSNDDLRHIAPSVFAVEPWRDRSSRYAFVPTIQLVEGLRSAGFFPYSAQQSNTKIEGKENFTRHLIRFRSQNVNLTQVGDNAVEAVLLNSHDGTSLYDFSLGVFRLACLNGMMVSDGMVEGLRIRHTGNIIEQVVESANHLIERAPVVMDTIREWRALPLSVPEQNLLAESAHSLRFEEGIPAPQAVSLLQPHRREDTGDNLWSVFNRIQENTVRGGVVPRDGNGYRLRGTNGRRIGRTRAVTGINENVKLNRALWSLAEKMAELKKAS